MPAASAPYHASIRLPPSPDSAAEARAFILQSLEQWGANTFCEQARLLVSELVTNAVFHAHSSVEIHAMLTRDHLRVEVADNDPTPPRPQEAGVWDVTGRGLVLVDSLAARWGSESRPGQGKVVWFEL